MYTDLKKALTELEQCLPEWGEPCPEQLHRMYCLILRLRSQVLSVIYDQEVFGGAAWREREPLAMQRSVGQNSGVAVTLAFAEPLPVGKELTAAVEEHWLAMLQAAIREAAQQGPLPCFEKAFVEIEIITPKGSDNAKVWDTSNRAINVIINNLKGVFFWDDDMEHMAFSVVGRWGKEGGTIIRISDFAVWREKTGPEPSSLEENP